MTENEWTATIKEFLSSVNFADNIKIDTLRKLPYAQEIIEYDSDFKPSKEFCMEFETDLLIYEKKDNIIKPRIVIESKLSSITTHDAITYSYKAQSHKNVTPFLRYGIMLGNRGDYPLPGRLFRHGSNFDFMISFQKEELSDKEKQVFISLIKNELEYSRKFEEMLLNSRNKDRKHYFLLQKELHLE
jgi:hypothetical protein